MTICILALATACLLAVSASATDKTGMPIGAEKIGQTAPGVQIFNYSENVYLIEDGNGKYGYVTDTWVDVVPPKYDYASSFTNGLAVVKKNGLYSFIDKTFKEVIPYQYTYIAGFYDNAQYTTVSTSPIPKDDPNGIPRGNCGIIDNKGKVIIPLQWDWIANFSDGLVEVEKDGKYGFLNQQGELVIPCKFDQGSHFEEGRACVRVGEKWGIIDKQGNYVVEPIYEGVSHIFKKDIYIIAVRTADTDEMYIYNYGLINGNGEILVEPIYRDIADNGNGYFSILTDSGNGLMDSNYNVVIEPKYSEFLCVGDNGLIAVTVNGKRGYMDLNEKIVIEPQYSEAYPFSEKTAWVFLNGISALINEKGQYVIPFSLNYNTFVFAPSESNDIILCNKGTSTDIYQLQY